MSLSVSLPTVCFIACHGGPADHFATFATGLRDRGYPVKIMAAEGPAADKLTQRNVGISSIFKLCTDQHSLVYKAIAGACSSGSLVITDVGHPMAIELHKELSSLKITHLAYYDNPESFVPGGYSSTAVQVAQQANGVLFANANLASHPMQSGVDENAVFQDKKFVGIGYYPIAQAKKIAEERLRLHDTVRADFLARRGLGTDNKFWTYFGGNNSVYFQKAFPTFIDMLMYAAQDGIDLSKYVIVIQQHPGAKVENIDWHFALRVIESYGDNQNMPKIVLSDLTSDEAMILADAVFYYQTSLGPQFVLAGIPTVQIGHDTYMDVLIKEKLAVSVTNTIGLKAAIAQFENANATPPAEDKIYKALGIKENWLDILVKIIKEAPSYAGAHTKITRWKWSRLLTIAGIIASIGLLFYTLYKRTRV